MEHAPDTNSKVFTDVTAYLDSRRRAKQCQVSTQGARLYSALNYNEDRDSLLKEVSTERLVVGTNYRKTFLEPDFAFLHDN